MSQLGIVLADRFAQALESQAKNATFIPRDCLHQLIAKEGIAAEDLHDFRALGWLGKECGADFAIAGTIDDTGESLVLMVELIRTNHPGRVQQRRGTLERTPEMVTLLAQPFHSEAPPPVESGIPEAGTQGIGEPSCKICPSPSFTDDLNEAMKGTENKSFKLTFRMVVDENGEVSDVAVVKGAPYGLTDRAIKTIRKWKLDPAKNPDGRPVKVRTLVEFMFRYL